jgi:heme-dependent oxidative N-demethylase alpha subunit-like protein
VGELRAFAPDPEQYRTATAPQWLNELDLSITPAHLHMGTRSLRDDDWLVPDALAPTELSIRRRLLAERRDDVFACTDYGHAPSEEVERLIMDRRAQRGLSGGPTPGESHPLVRVGSTVQEDLCLMVRHHGAWHLEAAVLCFPALWVLAEKLGQPTALVHQPVPHYATELSPRVDHFFDRLQADKAVWRRNFSLWPALLLWAPCHALEAALWESTVNSGDDPPLWIRSERQTLRRLRTSEAILFTIRVQWAPVSVLQTQPDSARQLFEWLQAPNGATRRKELGPAADPLLRWLSGVAGT